MVAVQYGTSELKSLL